MNGGRYNWRQDGKVAEVSAKALHNEDIERRYAQMAKWFNETRNMLVSHERHLDRLALAFKARGLLTGEEVCAVLDRA